MLIKLLRALAYFFYPPLCPNCGRPAEDSRALCADCRGQSAFVRLYGPGFFPPLDAVLVLAHYRGGLQNILRQVKFAGKTALLSVLTEEFSLLWEKAGRESLARACKKPGESIPAVIPIPGDEARRQARGYDLPEVIFHEWAAREGYVWAPVLFRTRATKAQYELSGAERRANMRGALAARALPPGDLWLIADDIMTTGATLSEAARALRAAGGEDKFLVGLAVAGDAREVSCLTLMPEVFFNEYTGKNCVVFKSHNE